MSKKFYLLLALTLALVASAFALWCVNKKAMAPVVSEPTPTQASGNESIDTSDWKTYRNDEYGFGFKYPKDWEIQEFMTAEIGLPVDCKRQPLQKECRHFTVRIFSTQVINGREGNIVIKLREKVESNATDTQSGITSENESNGVISPSTWSKRIGPQEFVKTNMYFPIFGSCYTTARVPGLSLKNNYAFFEVLYEVPGDVYVDELEKYCSQEIQDTIFDNIVASFSVF